MKRILTGVVLLIFTLGLSMYLTVRWTHSWSIPQMTVPLGIAGNSRMSYFAAGSGTAEDPYIIERPVHWFHLSYLHAIDFFKSTIPYFRLADTMGNPVTIDFGDPSLPPIYQRIRPIGSIQTPFVGVLDGNQSTLKNLVVDGSASQDIGVFGYIGKKETQVSGIVRNLFLERIKIESRLDPLVTTGFHPHNDLEINLASGFIVGHLGKGATLHNVFVISSTMDASMNTFVNRSQLGLIGYNEADGGITQGAPNQLYDFSLNANSTYSALVAAREQFGTQFVNGSSTLRLNDVLVDDINLVGGFKNNNLPSYSLSSLKISTQSDGTGQTYLYDEMIKKNIRIQSSQSSYRRDSIDVVGRLNIIGTTNNKVFRYEPVFNHFTSPKLGDPFVADTYDHSILLYVHPSANLTNLGTARISGSIGGGGELGFYPAFSENGQYEINKSFQNRPSLMRISNINVDFTMSRSMAFAALTKDSAGVLRVVDPSVTAPEYYVFVIGASNGFVDVSEITFRYAPTSLSEDSLTSISRVDFIDSQQTILSLPSDANPVYSLVSFSYRLAENQGLKAFVERKTVDTVDTFYMTFFYKTPEPNQFFTVDLFNLRGKRIIVTCIDEHGVVKKSLSTTSTILSLKFDSTTVTPS
jgi:hypothetical protein